MITGALLGLAAACLWALANVQIQKSSRRFGTLSAIVWMLATGIVLATITAFTFEGPLSWTRDAWPPLLVAGAAAVGAYGGLFKTFELGELAVVAPIVASWTIVSIALGAVFLSQPITTAAIAGATMVILGNGLIVQSTRRGDASTPPAALGWAALSALAFGVMVPAVDALGATVGRLWAVPCTWASELCLVVLGAVVTGRQIRVPARADVPLAVSVGVVEVAGLVSLTLGLGAAPLSVVTPAASLSTAASVALGLWVLRERPSRSVVVGAAIASVGVVVTSL